MMIAGLIAAILVAVIVGHMLELVVVVRLGLILIAVEASCIVARRFFYLIRRRCVRFAKQIAAHFTARVTPNIAIRTVSIVGV